MCYCVYVCLCMRLCVHGYVFYTYTLNIIGLYRIAHKKQ